MNTRLGVLGATVEAHQIWSAKTTAWVCKKHQYVVWWTHFSSCANNTMHTRCARRYCKSTCTIDLVCFKHFISKSDIYMGVWMWKSYTSWTILRANLPPLIKPLKPLLILSSLTMSYIQPAFCLHTIERLQKHSIQCTGHWRHDAILWFAWHSLYKITYSYQLAILRAFYLRVRAR